MINFKHFAIAYGLMVVIGLWAIISSDGQYVPMHQPAPKAEQKKELAGPVPPWKFEDEFRDPELFKRRHPKRAYAVKLSPKYIENLVFKDFKFQRTQDIDVLRVADYGVSDVHPILIERHAGRKSLDPEKAWITICAVLQRMSNVRSSNQFRALIFESMITETLLGGVSYEVTAKKFKNYGIAQFRKDSAQDLLKWLKCRRPDVHAQVMSFYDKKLNLIDNLTVNVPFCIAMMAQYYMQRIPDIHANIKTIDNRAACWSRAYNTYLGVGTIQDYKSRVKYFTKKHGFTIPKPGDPVPTLQTAMK